MKISLKSCVVLTILIALISISSAQTFHYDPGRTGNFSDIGPKTFELLWKANLTGLVGASPVYWDGKVYVSNWYGWLNWKPGLYSLNATTGSVLWRNEEIYGASSVAIDPASNSFFVGSLGGHFYRVNATTGAILWNITLENNPSWYGIASSPLVYNNRIYVTTFSNGTLHALDFDGNEVWNITTGNVTSSYSSPSTSGNLIYCVDIQPQSSSGILL